MLIVVGSSQSHFFLISQFVEISRLRSTDFVRMTKLHHADTPWKWERIPEDNDSYEAVREVSINFEIVRSFYFIFSRV